MRVLIISGLTCRVAGWIHKTTRHQFAAVEAAGGTVGFVADVPVPDTPNAAFFRLGYHYTSKMASQLQDAIDAFKPDLIHVSCGSVTLMTDVDRLANQARIPWIFTAHNIPPSERLLPYLYGHNKAYYRVRDLAGVPNGMAWKKLLRRGNFSTVIVHSSSVHARTVACSCPAEKVTDILFGADLLAQAPSDSQLAECPFTANSHPRVLCVAAMIHHKGLHDLLDAIELLVSDHPKISAVLIGGKRDPGYLAYIQKQIADRRLSDFVSLLVQAPQSILDAAWASATIYVQPSHEEGFCLSFLEGIMAVPRGIGTPAGAMIEMAGDDPFVRIIPAKAPVELTNAIRDLSSKDVTQDQLDQRRQSLRERFSWQQYVQKHTTIYQKYAQRPVINAPT